MRVMPVIRSAQRRRTATPNAVMTTLASPSQGQAAISVWRVDMRPGQAGPLHGVDAEQVWAVLEGGARVLLGPDTVTVGPGDTIVMPANVPRRVTADPRRSGDGRSARNHARIRAGCHRGAAARYGRRP
jgi:quercetin dioxygenase-like cupin family protein